MGKNVVAVVLLMGGGVANVYGQATGMPSFNSPYRGFDRSEYGVVASFPNGADAGFEALYRSGSNVDVAFRGGVLLVDGTDNAVAMFGAEIRQPVLSHSEDFPADGSVIFGAGVRFGDFDQLLIPIGLSLGRRLRIEDSDVSIVPFIQPTTWVVLGDNDDVNFAMGFGGDFRLSRTFDLLISFGLGDVDGVSFTALWVN